MILKDTVETARQMKQLKKRELEAKPVEQREAKSCHEEEELQERVKRRKRKIKWKEKTWR